MCYQLFSTICNVKDRQLKKHNVTFSLPILITQICKNWMLEDEYNEIHRDTIMIASESNGRNGSCRHSYCSIGIFQRILG